jgi:hypothetical protein
LVNVLVHPTLYNQLLAHGQWFSPGTPASSTTKTGRHDIQNVAEILLKVALKHQKSNKKTLYKGPYHLFPGLFQARQCM